MCRASTNIDVEPIPHPAHYVDIAYTYNTWATSFKRLRQLKQNMPTISVVFAQESKFALEGSYNYTSEVGIPRVPRESLQYRRGEILSVTSVLLARLHSFRHFITTSTTAKHPLATYSTDRPTTPHIDFFARVPTIEKDSDEATTVRLTLGSRTSLSVRPCPKRVPECNTDNASHTRFSINPLDHDGSQQKAVFHQR